jgi:hypothetical protein
MDGRIASLPSTPTHAHDFWIFISGFISCIIYRTCFFSHPHNAS